MKVQTLLRKKIGLDPESIGKKKIASDIRRCMAALGLTDEAEYVRRLETSIPALETLIDAVTVPETWFFRNRGAFDYLGAWVREEGFAASGKPALRILSVPCASGEEAYSIAMTLLHAGMAPEHFHIDAADVSSRVLADARRAVYGNNSFRGNELGFQKRYFAESHDGRHLLPEVKQTVHFIHDNILAPFFLSNREPYDVIFCRNLLIYFDREAQQRAVKVVSRLLKENGRLFVGHAETGLFGGAPFSPVRQSGVFAFQKTSDLSRSGPKKTDDPDRATPFLHAPVRPLPRHPQRVPKSAPAPTKPLPARDPGAVGNGLADVLVKKARSLADEGKLFEAAEMCEARLREDDTDTAAYCLMGLVRLALKDDSAAERYFNRVVLLDPNHYEALVHLALLKVHRGDRQAATALQQRADRARAGQADGGVENQP